MVSRSWVPIDTSVRCLARFWWSLSCNAMKDSYRASSKVMFLSTAPETYGLILAVCYVCSVGVLLPNNAVFLTSSLTMIV